MLKDVAREMTVSDELAQIDDDVLGDARAEVVLLRIAADIGERQDADPDPLAAGSEASAGELTLDGEDADGPLNVLQRHRPEIFKGNVQLSAYVLAHRLREYDTTRLGEGLQPRCDVDPFAIEIAVLDDHISQIEAHAEAKGWVGCRSHALQRDSARLPHQRRLRTQSGRRRP